MNKVFESFKYLVLFGVISFKYIEELEKKQQLWDVVIDIQVIRDVGRNQYKVLHKGVINRQQLPIGYIYRNSFIE